MMDNKFPGKDITEEDLNSKFPLASSKNKKKIIKIDKNISFGDSAIPIIAGPNGIENRDVIFKCCEVLEKKNLKLLRGGIYKPLTFPYRSKKYFEVGDEGLKILEEVKKNFDVYIVSEIMEEKKLPLIKNIVDIIQIGARNMQNYPLISSAAEMKKPILLKRHFGCSIRDLLGAAEYAMVKSNHNIILCERGVSAPHTHRDTSRFMLDIQAIVALKEIVRYPVISDPSHASFWSPWVSPLALASIAAGCDGLIIEMHPNPKKSMVDPLQPLNYSQFKVLNKKINKIKKYFNKK